MGKRTTAEEKRLEKLSRQVALNIQAARKARGLTQEQVEGFEPRVWQRFESGKQNLTLRTISRICHVLKIEPKDLFK
ncbi:MAG: hypothetical protein A4S09_17380 [Proteobacteria bacterium SG_bin7]|nr:MAG: hypothetical protein A4S09_17380 [Proteobacteria bacterium SG_bin7]